MGKKLPRVYLTVVLFMFGIGLRTNFLKNVYPHLINSFVLITSESDLSSPSNLRYLEESDSKIIHWFGQNRQYDASKVKKFTHIPIGKLDRLEESRDWKTVIFYFRYQLL